MTDGSDTPQRPTGLGLRLAGGFHDEVVGPMLAGAFPGLRYDAALVGTGSEVLGFDTQRSPDHGFGPRLQIFLAAGDPLRAQVAALVEDQLPGEYAGFATRFTHGGPPLAPGQRPPHQVPVTDVATWSVGALGVDATGDLSPVDWLGMPWQLLAGATGGAVFHASLGELDRLRAALAWYPGDVWRHVLAGQWLRIAQEEAFVGRTGEVGDDLGSALLTARLVRDIMRLVMLMRRRYPPYAKWLGSAFARLDDEAVLRPLFGGALRAPDWRERERHLCRAYEYVAVQHNALGLCEPVDPTCRGFWDRPFQVIDAERFSHALRAAITTPQLCDLPLIGSIDQVADSTDVLSDVGRSYAVNRSLY